MKPIAACARHGTTADGHDNFSYEPSSTHTDEAMRRHYCAVSIGLQAVDGLEVSPYLQSLAKGYGAGEFAR